MRLSITPLVEALRLGEGESVSRALGISGTALTTYAVNGVDERVAERLAVRAGFHASVIWPETLNQAIADITIKCEAPDCPETFIRKWRGAKRRFCSDTCRRRTNARQRYATVPTVRERRRDKARRYKAEVREAQRRRAERRAA